MSSYIDIKYLNLISPQLQQFKKKGEALWNFRCPYCGDSKKSKIKASPYDTGFFFMIRFCFFFILAFFCVVKKISGKSIIFLKSNFYSKKQNSNFTTYKMYSRKNIL